MSVINAPPSGRLALPPLQQQQQQQPPAPRSVSMDRLLI